MIAIVNYGIGNIGSILNMFKRIGETDVIYTSDKDEIGKADKIILPGVGAFDRGIEMLEHSGLITTLKDCALIDKKPFLGICLGMQLLTRSSEEGIKKGLGLIDAETIAFSFPEHSTLKIPHMGWNWVTAQKENPLMDNSERNRFYFVHSYYVRCNNAEDVLATTEYGSTFTCAFQHNNIFGTQFHPEKSHRFGLQLLKKFATL